MKTKEMFAAIPWTWRDTRIAVGIATLEEKIAGKKGAPEKRAKIAEMVEKYITLFPIPRKGTGKPSQQQREQIWRQKTALELAEKAGRNFDEHGYGRGDYLYTRGLDFIPPRESQKVPFCDMGGEGLALVSVTRTRVYAKSSKWRPSSVETRFLVGKNEVGTYFAHPVPLIVSIVAEALQWIWEGKAYQIVQRQGDVALIFGNGGPKIPRFLPGGHRVEGDRVVHATHPPLPLPQKGQRIIVGRRASERAAAATRD